MPVLKTTSPIARPGAPRDWPSNTVPSSNTRIAGFIRTHLMFALNIGYPLGAPLPEFPHTRTRVPGSAGEGGTMRPDTGGSHAHSPNRHSPPTKVASTRMLSHSSVGVSKGSAIGARNRPICRVRWFRGLAPRERRRRARRYKHRKPSPRRFARLGRWGGPLARFAALRRESHPGGRRERPGSRS